MQESATTLKKSAMLVCLTPKNWCHYASPLKKPPNFEKVQLFVHLQQEIDFFQYLLQNYPNQYRTLFMKIYLMKDYKTWTGNGADHKELFIT